MHFGKHHKPEQARTGLQPTARLMTLGDIDAYTKLRREMLHDSPWAFSASPEDDLASHPEAVKLWFDEPEHEVVVLDHPNNPDRLASALGIKREVKLKFRHRASIWGVYTTPDARGNGFARMIMNRADVLQLGVSGNAPAAMALYQSLGFEEWGIERDCVRVNGRSFDEHYLALRLND
jgi:ribosomal protein S18 acetylase RimI-like enzyme